MRTYRRLRRDYPKGVIAIYDNGGKSIDRYTVVYEPWVYKAFPIFQYLCMSGAPFHPQGFAQHGEVQGRRPIRQSGERVIDFAELPADCQACVKQDLTDPTVRQEAAS